MKKYGTEIPVDQLKHNQRVKVALTGTMQGEVAIYRAVSIEVAKLYSDFLCFFKQVQILEDVCHHKAGFSNWSCCAEHRSLSPVSKTLHKRAEKILPGKQFSDFKHCLVEKTRLLFPAFLHCHRINILPKALNRLL